MFDLFGVNKVDAKGAIQEMMCGATRGLLEGYEFRLEEKDREIAHLKEHIQDENTWKERYEELEKLIELKEQKKNKKVGK